MQQPGSNQGQSAPQLKVLTTQEIQQKLEENAMIISAIQENQNTGNLEECIKYQEVLQKNLMQLAALADAQQQSTARPQ